MRYDQTIFLVKFQGEAYNEDTGDYEQGSPIMYERQAHVSSAGVKTLNNLYGGITEGAIVIRLKQNYLEFDEILYRGKYYLPKLVRNLRNEVTIQAVEKQ